MPTRGSLAGKIALVTGANRGIGRGIALRLAEESADLALVARDAERLAEVQREIEALGRRVITVAADLREPSAPEKVLAEIRRAFGTLDILINNAGATKRGAFLELTDADWADGYALKLFGAVRLTRAAWPLLRERRGSVVNIGGVGGREPGAEFSIGGSVNAALMAFTKSLAELGVAEHVQVNLINPGSVRTDRLEKRIATLAQNENIDRATAAQRMVGRAGITRFGEPADVANLVAFIVSPAGRWMQGSLVDLDGGQIKTI